MNEYRHYRGRGRGNYQHGNHFRNQIGNNIYGSDVRRCNPNHFTPLLPFPPFRETRPRWQRPPQHNWRGVPRHFSYMRPYSPTNVQKQSRPLSPLPGSEEARQKAIAEASARIKQQLNLAEGDVNYDDTINTDETQNISDDCIILSELPPLQGTSMLVNKVQDKRRKHRKSVNNSALTPTIEELRKKILTQFTYMSKGKIQNLVNNPGSTRYDNALQHLVRDMRLHLSSELRNMYTNREADPTNEHNNMIDHFNSIVPDLGIELVSLPDTMVAELSKILQLDTNNEIEEDTNINENVLVEPEDMFKQAEKLLSSTDFLNVSFDSINTESSEVGNSVCDPFVHRSPIYNYPPPLLTTNINTTPTCTIISNSNEFHENIVPHSEFQQDVRIISNSNEFHENMVPHSEYQQDVRIISNSNEFHENIVPHSEFQQDIRFDDDSIVYENSFFYTNDQENYTNLTSFVPVVPTIPLEPTENSNSNHSAINFNVIPLPQKETEQLQSQNQQSLLSTTNLNTDPVEEESLNLNIIPLPEGPEEPELLEEPEEIENSEECEKSEEFEIPEQPEEPEKTVEPEEFEEPEQVEETDEANSIGTIKSMDALRDTPARNYPSPFSKKILQDPIYEDVFKTNISSEISSTIENPVVETTKKQTSSSSNKFNKSDCVLKNKSIVFNFDSVWMPSTKSKSKLTNKKNLNVDLNVSNDQTTKVDTSNNKLNVTSFLQDVIRNNLLDKPCVASKDFIDKRNKFISETSCESTKSLTDKHEESVRPFSRTRSHSPYDLNQYSQEKPTKSRLSLDERIKEMMKIQESRVKPKDQISASASNSDDIVYISKKKKKRQKKLLQMKRRQERQQQLEKQKRIQIEKQKRIQIEKQKRIQIEKLKEIERIKQIEKEKQKKIEMIERQRQELLEKELLASKQTNKLSSVEDNTISITSNLLNLSSLKNPVSATSKIPIKLISKTKCKTVKTEPDIINTVQIKDEPISADESSSSSENETETSTENLSVHNLTKDIIHPPKFTKNVRHFENIDSDITNKILQTPIKNFKIIVETNPINENNVEDAINLEQTKDLQVDKDLNETKIDENITETENNSISIENLEEKVDNENIVTSVIDNQVQLESAEIEEEVVDNINITAPINDNECTNEVETRKDTALVEDNNNQENKLMEKECNENEKKNNGDETTKNNEDETTKNNEEETTKNNEDETKNNEDDKKEPSKTSDKKQSESKKSESTISHNKKSDNNNKSSSKKVDDNKKHRHGSVERKKDESSKTNKFHKRSDSKHKTSHNHHHSSDHEKSSSSGKQKIINRLLDIDLQIQKLMQEKWNLYKELNITNIEQLPNESDINTDLINRSKHSKMPRLTKEKTTLDINVKHISTQTDFVVEPQKQVSDIELEGTPKKNKHKEIKKKPETAIKDNNKSDAKNKRKELDNKKNTRKRKLSESSVASSDIQEPINNNKQSVASDSEIKKQKNEKNKNNKPRQTRNSVNRIDVPLIELEKKSTVPKLKINLSNVKNSKAAKHKIETQTHIQNKDENIQDVTITKPNSKLEDEEMKGNKKLRGKKIIENETPAINTNIDESKEDDTVLVINTRKRTIKQSKKNPSKELIVHLSENKSIVDKKDIKNSEIDNEINNDDEEIHNTKRKSKKDKNNLIVPQENKTKNDDETDVEINKKHIVEKKGKQSERRNSRNRSVTPSSSLILENRNESLDVKSEEITVKRSRKRKANSDNDRNNKKSKLIKVETEISTIPSNSKKVNSDEEVENLLGFNIENCKQDVAPLIVLDLVDQKDLPTEHTDISTLDTEKEELTSVEIHEQQQQQQEVVEQIADIDGIEHNDISIVAEEIVEKRKQIKHNRKLNKIVPDAVSTDSTDNIYIEDDVNVTAYDKLVKSCFVQLERINVTLNKNEVNDEEEEEQQQQVISDELIQTEDHVSPIDSVDLVDSVDPASFINDDMLSDILLKEIENEDFNILCDESPLKELDVIDENGMFCMGHQKSILDIKIVGDEFFAASEDGTIYKYCLKSGTLQDAYTGHKRAVTCIHTTNGDFLNIDSTLLYSGSLDCTLKCYNIETAEVVHSVTVAQAIQCLDSAWGYIFLGTYEGLLFIYNMKILVRQEVTRKAGMALQPEEEVLKGQLENMQTQISVPTQFKGRINELLAQIRILNQNGQVSVSERYTMDAGVQEDIKQFLRMEQNGISHLVEIINTDLSHLKLIRDGMQELLQRQ